MTNSKFDRDRRTAGLVIPNNDAARLAPQMYATGALSAAAPGLYAFEDAHVNQDSLKNGGNDDQSFSSSR